MAELAVEGRRLLRLADVVIELALKDGRVLAFGPPADVLTPELLEALYGVRVAVTQVLAGGRSFSVCTPYAEEGR